MKSTLFINSIILFYMWCCSTRMEYPYGLITNMPMRLRRRKRKR